VTLPLAASSPSPPTAAAAEAIRAAFQSYHDQFKRVSRRAEARFTARDWAGTQQDAVERLTLYRQFASGLAEDLGVLLGSAAPAPATWARMKLVFREIVAGSADGELALSFFNSVARRFLPSDGFRSDTSFGRADLQAFQPEEQGAGVRRYAGAALGVLIRRVLEDLPFAAAFADLEADARHVALALARDLAMEAPGAQPEAIEMLPTPFYRNKGAYLVGRVCLANGLVPLLLPLVQGAEGVEVDALLTTSDEASIVFSFTRSYFHVDTDRPRATIGFLRSIMPRKPLDELYTSIGYNKHGKTVLFHNLLRQFEASEARFEIAEGDPGLVMVVFVLPSLNVVFKIIRDRFGAPKHTTRAAVMDRYHLVFTHDRVGRLADAHEFEDLSFRKDRFTPELLELLLRETAESVRVDGERVIVHHLYTERRVVPLNLYLRSADPKAATEAVLDYGQTIKDLAAANIFTGDMLLKNFGVTRHGRVIFYDYDELCLLTECNFRQIPEARDDADELSAEPWFYVGERDVFPEEFRRFLVLPGELGETFLRAHGDLLTVEFWRRMQELQSAGEMVDIFPYRASRRLRK